MCSPVEFELQRPDLELAVGFDLMELAVPCTSHQSDRFPGSGAIQVKVAFAVFETPCQPARLHERFQIPCVVMMVMRQYEVVKVMNTDIILHMGRNAAAGINQHGGVIFLHEVSG